MTRNEAKRRRWYDQGVDAIARVTDGEVGGYVCPMCATVCDLTDLTLEDAPPKALGGKPVALTCWNCNNGAHPIDAEMRRAEDLLDWRAGTSRSPIRARLAVRGGAPITVETERREGGAFSFGGLPRSNNPDVFARFQTDLEAMARRPSEEQALDVTFYTHRFTADNVRAGWLRAAYLIAFARFGYRYALRPLMAQVRDQIVDPEGAHIDRFYLPATNLEVPPDRRQLLEMTAPEELRDSLAVIFGRHLVFLPGFGPRSDTLYERLRAVEPWPPADQMRGRPWTWPTRPEHVLDHVRLTS